LPVGGIKEKVLAAHRAGLKTVVMPRKNDKDLIDVPRSAKRDLKFVFVDHMDEVLTAALFPPEKKSGGARSTRRGTKPAARSAANGARTRPARTTRKSKPKA